MSSSLPYGSCTILWSTQSGRAKACARRTARLLRSRGVAVTGRPTEPHDESDSDDKKHQTSAEIQQVEAEAAAAAATAGVGYGCAFDSYGAANFLQFGNVPCRPTNNGGSASGTSTNGKKQRLLIAFVSTTGDAEQCDTIRQTWSALLRKSLPTTTYVNVEFALFALGDRAYGPTAFCAAGRKLAARLVQLGATPFCGLGYGDDGTPNGGVFADLDVWLNSELLPKFGSGAVDDSIRLLDPLYRYRVIEAKDTNDMSKNEHTHKDKSAEEWQMEEYRTYYDEFFASACPATAYRYNDGGKVDTGDVRVDPPIIGHVVKNERITADDWMQDTRHIEIQVDLKKKGSSPDSTFIFGKDNLPYVAGDVATILPSNTAESVDRFLSVLPRRILSMADVPIEVTHLPGRPTPWPKRCTLRGLLTYCADINSLPEREDLRALAPYCNINHEAGSDHRDKLVSLSETRDAALYGDYVLREKRSWIDVLYDFDSIQYEAGGDNTQKAVLTVEHLLTILPPIMPRHFSIASSPSASILEIQSVEGFSLELCVAVVKGVTPHGRSYTGLCSGYLSRLLPVTTGTLPIRLWVRPGSFGRLPLQPKSPPAVHGQYFETPIMCIGAGTGVAPLRALILERDAVSSMNKSHTFSAEENGAQMHDAVDNILVFGCRKKRADFYYEQEWNDLSRRHSLRPLIAFSRDQYHKMYVQRVAREADDGTLIAKHILENEGAVYIAGGAKMAHCVKDEIVECLAETLPGGERDAKIVMRKLARAGRFSVEAWS